MVTETVGRTELRTKLSNTNLESFVDRRTRMLLSIDRRQLVRTSFDIKNARSALIYSGFERQAQNTFEKELEGLPDELLNELFLNALILRAPSELKETLVNFKSGNIEVVPQSAFNFNDTLLWTTNPTLDKDFQPKGLIITIQQVKYLKSFVRPTRNPLVVVDTTDAQ